MVLCAETLRIYGKHYKTKILNNLLIDMLQLLNKLQNPSLLSTIIALLAVLVAFCQVLQSLQTQTQAHESEAII